MRAAGIVSEYNPFHTGHLFHIESTRRALGGDAAIVAVMSGSFVQRGEFAVFDKFSRSEAAVSAPGGADLVIELPAAYAISSAERFATAGVELIDAAGVCDAVSFGSECGDVAALRRAAHAMNAEAFSRRVGELMDSGESYAAVRQRAADELLGADAALLRGPNNNLAIEYLRAVERGGYKLDAYTVRREGAEHDSSYAEGSNASAAYIRELMRSGAAYSAMKYIPDGAAEVFIREMARGSGPVVAAMADAIMMSALRRLTAADYVKISDVSEGLENRLERAVASARTVAEAAMGAKTKRYALARIRRILLAAFLGIDAELTSLKPQYLRVLAANARGRELLREMKTKARLPVITKSAEINSLGVSARRLFRAEVLAGDLYALARPSAELHTAREDLTRSPVMTK